MIIRRKNTESTLFANTIEMNGSYSPITEAPVRSSSLLGGVYVLIDTVSYSAIQIEFTEGKPVYIIIANQDIN